MDTTDTPRRPLLRRTSTRIALVALLVVFAGFFAAFRFFSSTPVPFRGSGQPMKAVVYHDYGPPDVLRLEEVEKPLPNENQVLVRVRAAAANPLDWHYVRGSPYVVRIGIGMFKPKDSRLGVDLAGEVVAVGSNVTQFKPGDEVFGTTGTGSFAEFARASQTKVVLKPASITFEQAAAVPVAALTALQGLRDHAKIHSGQKVLINGASGGVGTFAVQIAKAYGTEVTGVCSTRNVAMVRSIGADHVIDYTKEDFTTSGQRYDVIYDTVGNRSLSELRRVLVPNGIAILIGGGGPNSGGLIGSLADPIKAFLYSPFVSQKFVFFLAEIRKEDLTTMRELMEAGKVKPVIDRTYTLSQAPEAIRYLEQGHARGKVVIAVAQDEKTPQLAR